MIIHIFFLLMITCTIFRLNSEADPESAPGLADKHYAYDDARVCSLLSVKRRKWLKSLNVLTDVGTFKNVSSYSRISLPLKTDFA